MLECQDDVNCRQIGGKKIGSSWVGIIVREDDCITSYKWEYVRQIEQNRSFLNFRVDDDQSGKI